MVRAVGALRGELPGPEHRGGRWDVPRVATSTGGAYLPVLTSSDAETWIARPAYAQPACVGGPVDPFFNDALPCPAAWAPDRAVAGRMTKEVWAPGVAEVEGRFVAPYSVRQDLERDRFCISVATSSGPLGPFVDTSTGPVVCDARRPQRRHLRSEAARRPRPDGVLPGQDARAPRRGRPRLDALSRRAPAPVGSTRGRSDRRPRHPPIGAR